MVVAVTFNVDVGVGEEDIVRGIHGNAADVELISKGIGSRFSPEHDRLRQCGAIQTAGRALKNGECTACCSGRAGLVIAGDEEIALRVEGQGGDAKVGGPTAGSHLADSRGVWG